MFGTGLSSTILVHLLGELFSGLAYMHQRNVVHRDIKPDNIVLLRPLDQIEHVSRGTVGVAHVYIAPAMHLPCSYHLGDVVLKKYT